MSSVSSRLSTPFAFICVPGKLANIRNRASFSVSSENGLSVSSRFSGGYYAYNRQYIEQLPIRTIDFGDRADVARHDHLAGLAVEMLDLHRRFSDAKAAQDKTVLQRQIDATDRQIDLLVYELYGLTDEEIQIVEEATGQ